MKFLNEIKGLVQRFWRTVTLIEESAHNVKDQKQDIKLILDVLKWRTPVIESSPNVATPYESEPVSPFRPSESIKEAARTNGYVLDFETLGALTRAKAAQQQANKHGVPLIAPPGDPRFIPGADQMTPAERAAAIAAQFEKAQQFMLQDANSGSTSTSTQAVVPYAAYRQLEERVGLLFEWLGLDLIVAPAEKGKNGEPDLPAKPIIVVRPRKGEPIQ